MLISPLEMSFLAESLVNITALKRTYAIDGKVIGADVLKQYIEEGGGSYDNALSFYCGTGWRATIPFLIAYQDGKEDISLYDGGWWQWTVRNAQDAEAYPIQTITPEEAATK
mgnify:CR=1 FL=1